MEHFKGKQEVLYFLNLYRLLFGKRGHEPVVQSNKRQPKSDCKTLSYLFLPWTFTILWYSRGQNHFVFLDFRMSDNSYQNKWGRHPVPNENKWSSISIMLYSRNVNYLTKSVRFRGRYVIQNNNILWFQCKSYSENNESQSV